MADDEETHYYYLKEENKRLNKLVAAAWNPKVVLHRIDVQQLMHIKAEVPFENQDWSPSVEQENPELSNIKEEQEELSISPCLEEADVTMSPSTHVLMKSEDDEEVLSSQLTSAVEEDIQQLLDVDEVHNEQHSWSISLDQENSELFVIIKEEQEEPSISQGLGLNMFPFTGVPVKTEDDEEEAQSSQFHQRQNEANKEDLHGENCGESQGTSSFHLHRYLQPHTHEQNEDSEDTDDSEDWTDSRTPESHFNKKTKPPHSRSPEYMETQADGENCGGSEPDRGHVHMKDLKRRADPNSIQPFAKNKSRRSSDNRSSVERHIDTTRDRPSGSSVRSTLTKKKNVTCDTLCVVDTNVTNRHRNLKNDNTVKDEEGQKKPHSCSECKFTCRWKAKMRRHIRIHTGEKPFTCSECGTAFNQKTHLNIHIRIHTGEKPFTCSDCGTAFNRKSTLNRHMKIHTGEKVFTCSECGGGFIQKSALNIHMRIHTGEKPFTCSECDTEFNQKSSLNRHMRIHTG